MKIMQYRGVHPNFGDELNSWLWPRLMPGFFDEDESQIFVGIGSTIGDVASNAGKKIIFGAGYVPQYHPQPIIDQNSWDFRFVRGPRTASRLGLSDDMAIGDSGILTRTLIDLSRKNPEYVSFIPHWESMERGRWEDACHQAGMKLIDPRKPVIKVMEELMRSKVVIAEAMHGAIIADAFRIPWIPVLPLNTVHREKWYDWAESLGITLSPNRLWPSSLKELTVKSFRRQSFEVKPSPQVEETQHSLVMHAPSRLSRIKRRVMESDLAPRIEDKLIDLAAYRLTQLAKRPSCLSGDQAMDRATDQMLDKVHELRMAYAA